MKRILSALCILCLVSILGFPCQASKLRSGIRGKIVAFDTAPLPPDMMDEDTLSSGDPMPNVVVIIYRFYGKKRKEFVRIKTNSRGQFGLRCPPGQYSVMAKPREENNGYFNTAVKVKVQRNKFVYVQTNFDCGY